MSGTLAKLPVMIVALVIGLILTFTAVMPLVSDYSDTKTFTNDGIVHMTKYDADASITASWDHTKPNQITVNGDVISLPKFVTSGVEVALTTSGNEDYFIRYVSATQNNQTISFVDSSGSAVAGVNTNTDATITVSSGTITFTNGTDTKTATIDDYFFFVSKDGAYVMKAPTDNAYLNKDSDIYGIGRTKLGTSNYSMFVEGNINDGFSATVTAGSGSPTIADVTGTYSEVDSYLNLYSFEKVTFTASLGGTDYPVTYNQVIVPYEVSADPDNPTAYKNLVSVLPLFALILLVAGAASLVYFKNKD